MTADFPPSEYTQYNAFAMDLARRHHRDSRATTSGETTLQKEETVPRYDVYALAVRGIAHAAAVSSSS